MAKQKISKRVKWFRDHEYRLNNKGGIQGYYMHFETDAEAIAHGRKHNMDVVKWGVGKATILLGNPSLDTNKQVVQTP